MIGFSTTPLAALTTLRLGGPARRLIEARTPNEVIAAVRDADGRQEPVLVLGGGSNVVVADSGFPGTVVRVVTRGIRRVHAGGHVCLEAQAGEPWDPLVALAVDEGWAGLESLSGIPGLVGATPMQNVGAYGQEVSQTIVCVRAFDRARGTVEEVGAARCGFGYRTSVFKRDSDRWVVLAVRYALAPDRVSGPVAYPELARALGVEIGHAAPVHRVRAAVLRLRAAKGMVLDANDPDSVSVGSFFTNPVLTSRQFERFRASMHEEGPAFAQPDGSVKLSAAWLIEHAGFHRGYGNREGIAISSKHTLALTNRGTGTTAELVALARAIVEGVEARFGVRLTPEPVFAGLAWDVG